MEIAAEIIKSIAWPIAAIWIAQLFKSEVRALFGRVSHLKYKELEAQFEKGIELAKNQARQLDHEKYKALRNASIDGILTTFELVNRIALTSPRAAIIEYWIDLEAAISAAAKKAGISSSNTSKNVSKLIEMGHVSANVMPLYMQLKELRNQATHMPDFSITAKDAQAYLKSVLELGNEFRYYAVGPV
ncbi:DUF4145 domain-containing protein [Stutzerimonas stutzeri]|uniref:DUF4145 domain-containing protein n=1 Tax=Stutzerimonas stutzeri TaxID=316 RepID=UPI001C2E0E96|nr:DUF4145 domain-containing protein [Stutzerimonas stutzeri]